MKIALHQWFKRYLSDPQAAYLLFFIVSAYLIFSTMGTILAPVFVSIVIAYLLDWPVAWLQKLKCSHTVAVLIVFIAFIALIILLFLGIFPLLTKQISNFMNDLPKLIDDLQTWINHIPKMLPFIKSAQIDSILQRAETYVNEYGQSALTKTLSFIPNIISVIVYLVMVPLLVYFFMKDKVLIGAWLRKHFVPQHCTALQAIWNEANVQIGNYIRGKVLEALISSIVTYIAFIILGLHYSLLLAAVFGLSVFIPYIGAIVATIPVVIVGLLQWGWSSHFLYLMIAYVAILSLDGSLLAPLLFAQAVSLHPLAIILAVLIFGGIGGFWGVFFAIPLAALVNAIIRYWPRVPEKEE